LETIVTTRPFSLPCYLQGSENGRVVTIEIGESVGPTTLGRDWALSCLILNQYNNKIPKAINTITNYRKPISAMYTRTKTHHKHRCICCLLSLVKTYFKFDNSKRSKNRKHYFFNKSLRMHLKNGIKLNGTSF
jgi:hypothetical protein